VILLECNKNSFVIS